MITKEELQDGIAVCKSGEPTPEKMIRLGAYYTVMDHLFGGEKQTHISSYSMSSPLEHTETIDTVGGSDFLRTVRGKDVSAVMDIMDELMETMHVIQPRIYDSVMRRVSEIK